MDYHPYQVEGSIKDVWFWRFGEGFDREEERIDRTWTMDVVSTEEDKAAESDIIEYEKGVEEHIFNFQDEDSYAGHWSSKNQMSYEVPHVETSIEQAIQHYRIRDRRVDPADWSRDWIVESMPSDSFQKACWKFDEIYKQVIAANDLYGPGSFWDDRDKQVRTSIHGGNIGAEVLDANTLREIANHAAFQTSFKHAKEQEEDWMFIYTNCIVTDGVVLQLMAARQAYAEVRADLFLEDPKKWALLIPYDDM